MRTVVRLLILVPLLCLIAVPASRRHAAHAQEAGGILEKDAGATAAAPGAAVYFIDLQDGAVLPPRATIRFGLKGMGVAPAGMEKANTGHHHLLIDVETPPLDYEIPSDFNHLHFGGGQTEAEINLTPGEHTLQLILGDHDHVPHVPPVMSPRVRVVVREDASAAQTQTSSPIQAVAPKLQRKPAPEDAAVYFIYPRDGAVIHPTSTIRFGLTGAGVAPAGVAKANTGHHHLLVDVATPPPDREVPADANHMHFGAGQTEVRLQLPPGEHTLQLLLADENHVPHDPPIMSPRIKVTVRQGGPTAAQR